jgi:hypothetical protein
MQDRVRTLFRTEAVEHYIQGQQMTTPLRLSAPVGLVYLWIGLGLFIAGSLAAWSIPAPIYAAGVAVIAELPASQTTDNNLLLVAFLPQEYHARLHAGQPLFLHPETGGQRRVGSIVQVETQLMSPAAALQHFGLAGLPDGAAGLLTPQRVAVALTRLEPAASEALAATADVHLLRIAVEVERRCVLALAPLCR